MSKRRSTNRAVRCERVTDDLERPDLAALDWSAPERVGSLSVVFNHAVRLATDAEAWYARKRPAKKRCGRALRVGALVLGSFAVILPILTEISMRSNRPAIAPGWAAVTLAAAATLIALDHYFGFSTAWMRFMAAEMRVTRLRHDFEYRWNAQRARSSDPPTASDVAALLELARLVVLDIDDVVAEETDSWVAEFRSSLDRADQALRSTART
jgi:hypothetical protein